MEKAKTRMGKDGGGQRVRCGSSTLALSRRLVDPRLRLLEKDVIVLLEKDVNFGEQRQSRSSSGLVSPLHVQITACIYELSCMEIVWPSGHFLIRLSENGHLDNQKVSEKIKHIS